MEDSFNAERAFWHHTISLTKEKDVDMSIKIETNVIKTARKIGRTIGIPTANIKLDRDLIKSLN